MLNCLNCVQEMHVAQVKYDGIAIVSEKTFNWKQMLAINVK